MIRAITVLAAASLLTACAGGPKPSVVHKQNYVPVTIDAELLDPAKCPWPKKEETIILGTDLEGSDYLLKGYEAYQCEHMTRAKIKEQADRQAADIAKRKAPK